MQAAQALPDLPLGQWGCWGAALLPRRLRAPSALLVPPMLSHLRHHTMQL